MSRKVILGSGALAIVGAVAMTAAGVSAGQRISQGLSPSFADLSKVQQVEVSDQGGNVVLRGTFATAEETEKEIERVSDLTSPTNGEAKGKAEIEIAREKGVVTKDEIEFTGERLAPSATYKLMVDGAEAASFNTSNKGKVDLKLSRKMNSTK